MARKEKQYHFIYKTTNLLNGKYYYGMHSTDNLNDGYLGSGKRLRYSINKYGKEYHKREIIEFLENRKKLIEREKEVVSLNEIAKEDCMNLMIGGSGGFISSEQQNYRSSCGGIAYGKKIKNDTEFSNKISNIRSNIMKKNYENNIFPHEYSNRFLNKKHSEETKKLMKKAKIGYGIGENNSQYGTCWVRKNNVNKKIKLINLSEYINNGWVKGRKLK